jgi:hypothetical protein
MIHIGEKEYFTAIQNLVDGSNATVLYEGLRRSGLNKSEQAILRELILPKSLIIAGKDLLGIVHQNEALAYHPHWINTDLSTRQLARALKKTGVRAPKEENDFSWCKEKPEFTRWIIDHLLSNLIPVTLIRKMEICFSKNSLHEERTIITRRNTLALDAIRDKSKTSDVVTLWGAGHFEGIDKGIRKEGFLKERREWLNAYRLRKCRIRDVAEECILSLVQKALLAT